MDQIEEIKNRLNVLDIVGSYVKLTKTGVNYRGICPFHKEKGPSFFVSPTRQMWKCFGCGVGGDIFEFIKRIEGIEFGDALKILATKAGIELKKENPQLKSERQRLYEICDLACSFFEKQLGNSSWGKEAKAYLIKRGIKEETIKKWRLGYSPDTWQGLSDFLVSRGYKRDEIVKAGLAVQSEKGNNPYDRFRGRIIFPIFDINSQVIGFGARVFKESGTKETAKYINTPQTLLYDKSNLLYGLNHAKLAIRKSGQCVLTEGYTDAIMCHQAGFENTVAVSGTALTSRHLDILKRYCDNLLLSFDMDLAGDTATKRGINLAESRGFNIKVIDTYSGAKDPAEIILGNSEDWKTSVDNARTIMNYYFDSAFLKFDKNTPEGKKEIAKIILPAIKRMPNKIEQAHWVSNLSDKLSVSQTAVLDELKNVKIDNAHLVETSAEAVSQPSLQKATAGERRKLLEDKVISLIMKSPEVLRILEEEHNNLFSERTKNFIDNIKNNKIPEEDKDFLNTLSMKTEIDSEEDSEEEIQLCLLQLKDIDIRERRHKISQEIKKAELAGDNQKVNDLIGEFKLIN
jgi:DNA primase